MIAVAVFSFALGAGAGFVLAILAAHLVFSGSFGDER